MKKRIFSVALSLCMAVSLLPGTALAADGTEPGITDMSISYNDSAVEKTVSDGSFIFEAPIETDIADYTVSVTLSDGAAFTATTPEENNNGELYVAEVSGSEVTLKFNMTVDVVDLDSDQYALTLTSAGNNTWTGGFENAGELSLTTMAGYLASSDIYLSAGALGTGSAAQDILVNKDDSKVVLAVCDPDVAIYTVDYVVDDSTTITWKLPAGAVIPPLELVLSGGKTIEGWYLDSDFHAALTANTTVAGNTTVYADVNAPTEEEMFLGKLQAHEDVTIYTKAEWDTFVEYSDVVIAGQLISLGDDIDCQNTTYDSMTFAGSFNGNGKTISNANFRAVSTSSGDTCSGMFAKIGPGQVVANLTLQNVTAQYSGTYAGVLAGMVDGAGGGRTLVQNVQVRNSSASGRSAGGVAGFIRNADVRYCSSRDTTITGLANGGGIVGLNNSKVEYCYSTTSPTALTFLGGKAGGVVGKNVRGAFTEYCWSTMTVVGGSGEGTEAGGTDIGAFDNVSDSTTAIQFVIAGFTQECWVRAAGTATDFNPSVIFYTFA